MNRYKLRVVLDIEAYTLDDAKEVLQDVIGEFDGLEVLEVDEHS